MSIKIIDVYRTESYTPVEPVTLAEAKAWALIDFTDDDSIVTGLITQSRGAIEDFCHISIVPKTILLTAQNLPDVNYPRTERYFSLYTPIKTCNGWYELPYGPVGTVSSVTSIDSNGTATTLTLNVDYWVTGQEFKTIRVGVLSDNLLIQYSTSSYLPQPLKEAVLNEIAFRYENRGSGLNRYAQQNVGVSEGAQALALPYQRLWI